MSRARFSLVFFLLAVLLAGWFRFSEIGIKPFHHDEGVNSYFLLNLERTHSYQYNPENYHGPSLYYFALLSVALFDRPAFKNCICHGVVLDEDGRKLSKRLRNYPDPEDVFETIGSDALRWFLMSSPILRGLDLRIDRDGALAGVITADDVITMLRRSS